MNIVFWGETHRSGTTAAMMRLPSQGELWTVREGLRMVFENQICDRCHRPTVTRIMSMFNLDTMMLYEVIR